MKESTAKGGKRLGKPSLEGHGDHTRSQIESLNSDALRSVEETSAEGFCDGLLRTPEA